MPIKIVLHVLFAGPDEADGAAGHRFGDAQALLLPADADASAARLREGLQHEFGVPLGVIITDSIGRAWRLGTVGIAIGCAGVTALQDLRGQTDLFGRTLLAFPKP